MPTNTETFLFYQGEVNNIAKRIEQLIEYIIVQKGLVDTGELSQSVKAITRFSKTGFNIDIESVDYFKYVDKEYRILDAMMMSPEFKKITDEIANLYAQYIKKRFTQIIIDNNNANKK